MKNSLLDGVVSEEEARKNEQLYSSKAYKTAMSLYLDPKDNYSELIDLINWSVEKKSYVGKRSVVVTLIADIRKSVIESIDVSKAISFLKGSGYSVIVSGSVNNYIADFIVGW